MNIISKDKAKEIAGQFYDGQWSALYQFCSSGVFIKDDYHKYLTEIDFMYMGFEPKYKKELKQLRDWFTYKNNEK
jgi:hypothetical protein